MEILHLVQGWGVRIRLGFPVVVVVVVLVVVVWEGRRRRC
jgi:uncharacterized membrane protein YqiK